MLDTPVSGSPIIQNGKLAGAVTRVWFLKTGYTAQYLGPADILWLYFLCNYCIIFVWKY